MHGTGLLARREREILNVIFELGNRASAEDVRSRLIDPPTDSTVRVILSRLEKKGYVSHKTDGIRYLYSATVSPAAAKRLALRQCVQTYFRGSLTAMALMLVRQDSWSESDLSELKAEIEKLQGERKR